MTQLLILRKEVADKLGIGLRQLRNLVREVSAKEGIPDRDVALLLVAHRDAKLPIKAPRFDVPEMKITVLQEHLRASRAHSTVQASVGGKKKEAKEQPIKIRRLLHFKGKYPLQIFYDPLEDEINIAYSNQALPNAVLLLSRKLIENLVYNLLEYKFDGPKIDLYYNVAQRRAQDFSILLDNLKNNKSDFDPDHQPHLDQFFRIIEETKFRREANSTTHKVMDYLDSMREISKFKIPQMTQILLHLIDRVREPKGLSLIEVEYLENGARVVLLNVGNSPEDLTEFAIGEEGRHTFAGGQSIPVEPGQTVQIGLELRPERFKTGETVEIHLWSQSGREFRLKMPSGDLKTRR